MGLCIGVQQKEAPGPLVEGLDEPLVEPKTTDGKPQTTDGKPQRTGRKPGVSLFRAGPPPPPLTERGYFMLGVTVLFVASAVFAHVTNLYKEHPDHAVSIAQHLSSYVVCLVFSLFLYSHDSAAIMQGERYSTLSWCVTGAVAIGWTLVQEFYGTDITVTLKSILTEWDARAFWGFGACLFAMILALLLRIREFQRMKKSQYGGRLGFLGTIAVLGLGSWKSNYHVHHWFIGFALALSMANTQFLICKVFRFIGFGLFLHGVAAWKVGDLFEPK